MWTRNRPNKTIIELFETNPFSRGKQKLFSVVPVEVLQKDRWQISLIEGKLRNAENKFCFNVFSSKRHKKCIYTNVAQTKQALFVSIVFNSFCFIFILFSLFFVSIFCFRFFPKIIFSSFFKENFKGKNNRKFFWSQTKLNYNFNIHINKHDIYTDCRIEMYMYYIYILIIYF